LLQNDSHTLKTQENTKYDIRGVLIYVPFALYDVGKYLYVFGGYEEPSERLGRDVYRLDFSTFTWQLLVSQ
jgi:hypothetical protein